jgi:hypothetical protein
MDHVRMLFSNSLYSSMDALAKLTTEQQCVKLWTVRTNHARSRHRFEFAAPRTLSLSHEVLACSAKYRDRGASAVVGGGREWMERIYPLFHASIWVKKQGRGA